MSIYVSAVRDGHERRAAIADNDIDMGTGATSIPVAPTRPRSLCDRWTIGGCCLTASVDSRVTLSC